jgi:hypothetical protein
MANTDAPFGLRPVMHRNGAAYNGAVRYYFAPATYATAIFIGDPVVKTGTANTTEVSAPGAGKFGPGTLPEVNVATVGDGNAITGVVVSIADDADSVLYGAASTARVIAVADDPDLLFEIQADGTLAATSVGLNAVLIATHSGSTSTGLSGMELDTTSDVPAADASNQLTIVGFPNREDVDLASANVNALVKINNHTEAHGAIGL